MQELVSKSLGWAMAHHHIGDGYRDAVTFGAFLNSAVIAKTWPRWMLSNPTYLRAKRRMERRMDRIIRERAAQGPGKSGERDLLDMLVSQPVLTHIDRRVTVQLSFMAGDDTAAPLLGCVLYELHTRPAILARVQAEVDAAFADCRPDAEIFRHRLPTLWSVIREASRLHPVFSGVPHVAACDFTFAGCRVKAGQWLIFATPVTHFADDYFPNPDQFDVAISSHSEEAANVPVC